MRVYLDLDCLTRLATDGEPARLLNTGDVHFITDLGKADWLPARRI